jgi:hypothetical protein
MAILLSAFVGFLVSIVQSSFAEWAFHRYWLHRPWLPKDCFTSHTLVHHQLCKFDDTFHVVEEEQRESLTFQWWGGPTLILIILSPWLLLAWWLGAHGVALPYVPFLVSMGIGMSLYYAGYEGFHYLMHVSRSSWLERTSVLRFLIRHHRIHHARMNRNFNVLLPFADLLLGTLVTQVPAMPPTPESAREIARRHSAFGKREQEHIL